MGGPESFSPIRRRDGGRRENVAKLLDELVGMSNREARFVCALCLLLPNDQDNERRTFQMIEVEGYCEGDDNDPAPRSPRVRL